MKKISPPLTRPIKAQKGRKKDSKKSMEKSSSRIERKSLLESTHVRGGGDMWCQTFIASERKKSSFTKMRIFPLCAHSVRAWEKNVKKIVTELWSLSNRAKIFPKKDNYMDRSKDWNFWIKIVWQFLISKQAISLTRTHVLFII